MSEHSVETGVEEQRSLERFYYQEARLLDSRQYLQWLTLLSPEVRYVIPSRVNVQIDNRQRGSEDMLAIDNELEGVDGLGNPVRDESYVLLMVRAERAYKINSWSENPPPRTRRIIGNVELMAREDETLSVLSNFHLNYARPGNADVFYSGQRRDLLIPAEEGYLIQRREVILDYAKIEAPTLGLFF
ncbi:MAG: aromatic-ring-hydroxylating dioxygenase subunit beta [Halioglobus sp.]